MHELVETVLTIGPRLSKDDWSRIDVRGEPDSILSHSLSIAFHIELLDMSRELEEGLAVRKDGSGAMSTDVVIVEPNESQENRDVLAQIFSEH